MRIFRHLAVVILFSLPMLGQAPPKPDQPTCQVSQEDCKKPPSKADLKKAHKLYQQAEELQKKTKFQEALVDLDRAVEITPHNVEYLSFREKIRQQLVTLHLGRGNQLLKTGKNVEAMAEFRQAIAIDPKNEYVLQRLQDTLPPSITATKSQTPLSHALTVVSDSRPAVVHPKEVRGDFHFKGMTRNLLEQMSSTYGVKAMFDESVLNRQVKMDIEDVDFYAGIREASKLAHVFWIPVSQNEVMFINDTPALRREFEHMVARTFYISDSTAPQDINDVVNLLRTIFDLRFVAAQPSNNSVSVRGPAVTLDAAAKVVETFISRKPQVNLQVRIFQVSHQLTRQIGISLPLSFQAIDVGAAALAALGQGPGNIQDLINQIIATGAINNVDQQGLQALIAQLQSQQNSQISQLLQTPFATFGGGKTLFAVPIPPTTANFSLSQSDFQTLSDVTLRTAQNNAATMLIGERFPILNASFAPLFNTAAVSQVIANGSFTTPFPSFTYEDIGISLKATPQVLGDNSVNLKLELSVKALTGQNINSIPVISNREYTATVSVGDGEPAAVAGMITKSEQKSLSGIPGLGRIPVLRGLTSNQTKMVDNDELLIVITPHIVSPSRRSDSGDEVWVPAT
jgi:type II secretory pathway component GspD/PulD (secretin)